MKGKGLFSVRLRLGFAVFEHLGELFRRDDLDAERLRFGRNHQSDERIFLVESPGGEVELTRIAKGVRGLPILRSVRPPTRKRDSVIHDCCEGGWVGRRTHRQSA